MFRRCFLRASKGSAKELLSYWSIMCKHNIRSPADWKALPEERRAAVLKDGLPKDIAETLDTMTTEGKFSQQVGGAAGGKNVLISYGSHTGTSETYAKMLATYAVGHGYTPIVCSLNDALQVLEEGTPLEAMLICCSTAGTGEFPRNSEKFWQALDGGKLNDKLKDVRYTIMGLGNSSNDNFNAAAKKIDKKLKEIGAKNFLRMQLSCELQANGHDATFRTWKRSIWAGLGGESDSAAATAKLPETYKVETAGSAVHRPNFFKARVSSNPVVSAGEYSPVSRLLTFRVPLSVQEEQLGRRAKFTDQVQVHPRNSKDYVQRTAKALGLNLAEEVELSPQSGAANNYFDNHALSVEWVLTNVVDLSAIPSRTMLETLAAACPEGPQRTALDDLANDLNANSEYDKLVNKGWSVVDLLEKFDQVKLTLAQLLSLAPQITPRTYSLACDNTDRAEEFEVVYNVPTKENHHGLCTSYMETLSEGDDFEISFLPEQTTLPKLSSPVAIIALGTGIGSARSLLQSRKAAKDRGENVGNAVLLYGFRNAGKDQLFKEELDKFMAEGLVDVRYVPSMDEAGKYITPMDKMDRSIVDFLGTKGEVVYCGLGGSVPLKLETALQRNGVDTAALRSSDRYHEEFFTADLDVENLLKDHSGAAPTDATLLGRMGNTDMFCFQCEQTFKGKGCHKIGVCGKTPRVAALQDLTVHAAKLIGFYAHNLRQMGVADNDEVNHTTLYALFATLTNVNFDEERFVNLLGKLQPMIASLKKQYEDECAKQGKTPVELQCVTLPSVLPGVDELVELGRSVGVLRRFSDPETQSGACATEMLMYGLKGIAAYTDHSLMNKRENKDIYEFVHRALAHFVSPDSLDLGKGLALALEAGKINVASMSLLYDSNKTLGVPTPNVVPVKPAPGKCILVSGHDLIILKGLLEKTEPLGINVYTHGEMLPAHSYPLLKQHKNLVGHYGGAWMRQSIEFPHFPGPVLMTTNCLTEPHETYAARIFTAGAVGWSGIPHIGNTMDDINFDELIKSAQETPGFQEGDKEFAYPDPVGQKRPETLTVGYGHETVLSVAPTIIEEINKGNITRFFVVGGCDGFEGQRSYYTELVQKLPKTAVVLTVGCGKFRINHLELGTIGETGIPRVLDMGQCNDSFSAVQVALALADVLKCQVSDLPLSIVLSWFEQKAVAVLLSCLHLGLKPIHVGPSLPAFVTPEILEVLVRDFGIKPTGDPEEDLKVMLAAKGAS